MVLLMCVIGVGLAGAIAVAFAGVAEAKSHHTSNYYGSTFGPQTPPTAIIRSSGGAHTSTPLKSSAGTSGSGGSNHAGGTAGGTKGTGTATGGTGTGTGTHGTGTGTGTHGTGGTKTGTRTGTGRTGSAGIGGTGIGGTGIGGTAGKSRAGSGG